MKINKNDKVLILLSGGQDSITCALDILSKIGKDNICALSFKYDSEEKECIKFAASFCEKYKIKHEIYDYNILSKLSNGNIIYGRNLFFLSAAALYAKFHHYTKLVIGLSKDDFNCYNDCKEDFVVMTEKILNYSLEYNIEILAPYINKNKVEIWQIADKLNKLDYVKNHSYSCWANKEVPCRECLSCKIREESYNEYKNNKH